MGPTANKPFWPPKKEGFLRLVKEFIRINALKEGAPLKNSQMGRKIRSLTSFLN